MKDQYSSIFQIISAECSSLILASKENEISLFVNSVKKNTKIHVEQVKNCSYVGLHCFLYQYYGFRVKKKKTMNKVVELVRFFA